MHRQGKIKSSVRLSFFYRIDSRSRWWERIDWGQTTSETLDFLKRGQIFLGVFEIDAATKMIIVPISQRQKLFDFQNVDEMFE